MATDEEIKSMAQLVYQNRAPVRKSYLIRNVKYMSSLHPKLRLSIFGYSRVYYAAELAIAVVFVFITTSQIVTEDMAYTARGWPKYADVDIKTGYTYTEYEKGSQLAVQAFCTMCFIMCAGTWGYVAIQFVSGSVMAVVVLAVALAVNIYRAGGDVKALPFVSIPLLYGALGYIAQQKLDDKVVTISKQHVYWLVGVPLWTWIAAWAPLQRRYETYTRAQTFLPVCYGTVLFAWMILGFLRLRDKSIPYGLKLKSNSVKMLVIVGFLCSTAQWVLLVAYPLQDAGDAADGMVIRRQACMAFIFLILYVSEIIVLVEYVQDYLQIDRWQFIQTITRFTSTWFSSIAWCIVTTYPRMSSPPTPPLTPPPTLTFDYYYGIGAFAAPSVNLIYELANSDLVERLPKWLRLKHNKMQKAVYMNVFSDVLTVVPLVVDILVNKDAWPAGVLGVVLINIGLKVKQNVYNFEVPEKLSKQKINAPKGIQKRTSGQQRATLKRKRIASAERKAKRNAPTGKGDRQRGAAE